MTSFSALIRQSLVAVAGIALATACIDPERPRPQPAPDSPSAPNVPLAKARSCQRALRDAVESIHGEVTATVYVTTTIPEYDAAGRAMVAVLRALERLAPGRLRVAVHDVVSEQDERAAQQAAVSAAEAADGRAAYLGVALACQDRNEVIALRAPEEAFRFSLQLVTKLARLRNQVEHTPARVGVLSKSGAPLDLAALVAQDPGPEAGAAITSGLSSYRFEDVGVGSSPIDPTLRSLVVLGGGAWDDAELRRVDDFVIAGKGAAFFVSSAKLGKGGLAAELAPSGLEPLLSGYGVDVAHDVVFDSERSFAVRTGQGGDILSFPALLAVYGREKSTDGPGLDEGFLPFSGGSPLPFPAASTLAFSAARQPKATGSLVARTSSSATSFKGRFMLTATQLRGEYPAQRALAVAVEGALQPAMPRRDAAAWGGSPDSRILVVASPLCLVNPFREEKMDDRSEAALLSRLYVRRNVLNCVRALQNTLDWLAMTPDVAACASSSDE